MLAFFPLPKQLSVSFNKHVEGSRKSPSNSWNKDKKGSSCVNSMLFFTDVVEQHSFEVYARKETTSFSLCLLNLVLTGYFTYILSITYSAPLNFLSWTLISIAFIFVSMIALLVLFVSKRNINWLKFFEQKHWQEQSMENYFCLLLTITLGVVFYEREFYERKLLSTSSVTHNHFLATETLFLLFICPICLKIVFGQLYWSTELIMFAFSASFSCSAIGVFSATRSIALVIMTLVVIFAMMYLRRYQIIYTYYEKKRGLERTGLISTVRDMSEQEFSIAHSEAIEWRYLLANIAHDLKTPLTALSNGCDMLQQSIKSLERNTPRSDEVEVKKFRALNQELKAANETVKGLTHSCAFMNMIINRCIDYTKASHGLPITPTMESVDLRDIIEDTIACVSDLQIKQTIKLQVSHEISSSIITDKQWLHENLLCLVANAVKFGPKGDIQVDIQLLNEKTSKPMLLVSVEDHGIGVPLNCREDLFEPNHQSKFNTGGTGLGLYCLFLRAKALNGECGITDRLDQEKGSRFWFTIQYVADDSKLERPYSPSDRLSEPSINHGEGHGNTKLQGSFSSQIVGQSEEESISAASSRMSGMVNRPQLTVQIQSKYKILVVDDSLPILKMTTKMLEKDGHVTVQAMNGRDALDCLHVDKYDIVLMDLQMPIMDGFEAVRTLRDMELQKFIENMSKIEDETLHEDIVKDKQLREGETPTICYQKPTPGSTRTLILGNNTHKVHPCPIPVLTSSKEVDHSATIVPNRQLIIGCSANSDQMTMEDAFRAGVDDFLAKPFTLKKFNDLIERKMR